MHSAGLELTKLTYTRLEDNLIRHRGDRQLHHDDLLVCRDWSNTKIVGPGVFPFGDLSVGGQRIGFRQLEKGPYSLA